MSLQHEIAQFLQTDPVINRIHFRYQVGRETFLFHAGDYRAIGARIGRGTISVVEGSFEDSEKFGARYEMTDRLILQFPTRSLSSDDAKAAVVHECTHAIQDMQVMRIRVADGEVCAYLAEHVWRTEVSRRRTFSRFMLSRAQADRIARSERARENQSGAVDISGAARGIVRRYRMTERRVSLYSSHVALLRQAISRHGIYREIAELEFDTNGVRRFPPSPTELERPERNLRILDRMY